MSSENKKKQKEELILVLYEQAEKQLIDATTKAEEQLKEAQRLLQDAQNNRIAVQAQLSLIKKVNERVEEILMTTTNVSKDSP